MTTREQMSKSADHEAGHTALMLAASSGGSETVRVLLSKGADVSGKFIQTGKTALMLAEEKGYTDIVQLLEAARA